MAQIVYILSSVRHARELEDGLVWIGSFKNHFVALPSERVSMLDSYVKHTRIFSGASELMFCDALSAEKLINLMEQPEHEGLKNILKVTPMIVITMLNDMAALEKNLNVIGYMSIKNTNAENIVRVTAAFYEAQKTGGKMECEGFQPVRIKSEGKGVARVSAEILDRLLTHSRRKAPAGDASVTGAHVPVGPNDAVQKSFGFSL